MKNKLLLILFVWLFSIQPAWAAGSISLVTYYPSPQGAFDRLTLLPTSLTLPCNIGTLQLDQTSLTLQYCSDNGVGVGQWGPLSSVWTQSANNLYPAQTLTNNSIKVGIGTLTTSPEFKLTLDNDAGILAIGTFGSGNTPTAATGTPEARLMWYPKKGAFRVGEVASAAWDDANIGNYSVVLSYGNIASGLASVNIGGNTYEFDPSQTCITTGDYSTVLFCNPADTNASTTANYSTILDFFNILTSCDYCTQSGTNMTGSNSYVSLIGDSSTASGLGSTIISGYSHDTLGNYSTIGSGDSNDAYGAYSTISGGMWNYIGNGGNAAWPNGDYATISGGSQQNIYFLPVGQYSTIGGGFAHLNRTNYATIAGGYNCGTNVGTNSLIGGGSTNAITGSYSTILGGLSNGVSGSYSIVAGGRNNTVSGAYSAILGGGYNSNAGDYSLVAGYNMNLSATADRTFLWGYNATALTVNTADSFIIANGKVGIHETDITVASDAILNIRDAGTSDYFAVTRNTSSTAGDIFIVKNNGWIGIGKASPAYPIDFGTQASGAHITAGGVWTTLSSRSVKEDIRPLTLKEAQEAFNKLKPVEYNYRLNPREHHIGFIAEEMPALLAEKDRNSVNPMGINAVLTVIMQDNDQTLLQGSLEIKMLKEKLRKLEEKLK